MLTNATINCDKCYLRILGSNISSDILVEEFQHKRDAIGENQVLRNELKLIYVIYFGVLQKKQDYGGDRLHDNFLVTSNVDTQLH